MEENDVLIVGAGPAGMATAFELNRADWPFTLIEKNDRVGGLARTLDYGEFRTDTGPHRFFNQHRYPYDMIGDLLGERWLKVDRFTRFYINGKFYIYPIDIKNALFNAGVSRSMKIIFDYASQSVKKRIVKKQPASFEEKIVSEFGRSLAELNMLNYTEKLWGLPCSQISPAWADQRIKDLSMTEVLKKIFVKSGGGPKTMVDQFYYPDDGTGLIYEKMKERFPKSSVKLNSRPVKIIHEKNRIKEVVVAIDGSERIVRPGYVVSTIPITEFVRLMEPSAPVDVIEACGKLKYRFHVSLFITLRKPSVFRDQWIYFPDKGIPFARIMEPRNFSAKLSPAGKTSLLLEFFCWEGDTIWNADKKELFAMSIPWLEKIGFIKRDDVIDCFVHKEKYAYPVYGVGYAMHASSIKSFLKQFRNLQMIGRGGSFRYNNQDHALEMGILAAKNITEGKNYDTENVGSEQAYFERGYVK
ncbi:MAG: FAD-dependent oxidoreductase [Candidatus Aenigmatarchaeota archaeon]